MKFATGLPLILATVALTSCGILQKKDDDQAADPEPTAPIKEVIIVGTSIDAQEFHTSKSFTLIAVPKSEEGKAILSPGVSSAVSIDKRREPGQTEEKPSEGITADPRVGTVNQPSTNELAISLDIDASGSMSGNDPKRLRVSGAKTFFNVLQTNATTRPFSAAVFGFGRFLEEGPVLDETVLLQDFSNDVAKLDAAADKIQDATGTPTYSSLLAVLDYTDKTKPAGAFERKILLFSDGEPTDWEHTAKEVCEDAKRRAIPIHTIGLGPASDLDPNYDPTAADVMRELANCSGGAYAGVKTPAADAAGNTGTADDASVKAIYTAMATAASDGSLDIKVTLAGEGVDKLEPGTVLTGTLKIGSGGKESSASFSMSVPAKPEAQPVTP